MLILIHSILPALVNFPLGNFNHYHNLDIRPLDSQP